MCSPFRLFQGGSQSIVSLVQNVNDPNQVKSSEAGSFFPEKEKAQEMEQEDEQSSDEDDDTGSISSVHIGSDPLHIQLSSTIFDSDLLNYLVKHPTTKNSLAMVDENGGVIRDQGILAMNPDVSKEKDKKRLGLLSNADLAVKYFVSTFLYICCVTLQILGFRKDFNRF
uniref:NAC domain-containing protein n=1 Tax=Angiostrongylus cantonensis TaxID=6313 RepID=A0A0K0D8J1_ANGCA